MASRHGGRARLLDGGCHPVLAGDGMGPSCHGTGCRPVGGPLLTVVGLGILAAGLLGLRFLPGADPVPGPGQATDQWWMTSQARLIVRWAVVEGGSLVNAVLWYMSRDRVSLLAAIAGLAILFALRPSRYLE